MLRPILLALALAAFTACPPPRLAQAAEIAVSQPLRIVAFGDSLTSGYGLKPQQSFPVQLERELRGAGYAVAVENASAVGDTTATALARLERAVPADAEAVIIELGANDMLWGEDPSRIRQNLDAIITRLKARGQKVILLGMVAIPFWSNAYRQAFDAMYHDLARKHRIPLDPFVLYGVVLDPGLNQPDGIHPNAAGAAAMAKRLAPFVASSLGLRAPPEG